MVSLILGQIYPNFSHCTAYHYHYAHLRRFSRFLVGCICLQIVIQIQVVASIRNDYPRNSGFPLWIREICMYCICIEVVVVRVLYLWSASKQPWRWISFFLSWGFFSLHKHIFLLGQQQSQRSCFVVASIVVVIKAASRVSHMSCSFFFSQKREFWGKSVVFSHWIVITHGLRGGEIR